MKTINTNNLNTFEVFSFGETQNTTGATYLQSVSDPTMYQSPPFNPNPCNGYSNAYNGPDIATITDGEYFGKPSNNTAVTTALKGKEIQIVDVNGIPLSDANIKVVGTSNGGVTDANGYIILPDVSTESLITISYVGKKPVTRKLGEMGSLITLQDLPMQNEEIVLTQQQKANKTLMYGAIGAGLIFLLAGVFSKDKKGKNSKASTSGLNAPKTKKRKKSKSKKRQKV